MKCPEQVEPRAGEESSKQRLLTIRECSVCGRTLPANYLGVSCPVCLLQFALEPSRDNDGLEENCDLETVSAETDPRRYGPYEILTRPDGSLDTLGRGAMGVTYKATDLNLGIPVALKILNPRLLQEGLARRRFLREARSAASVRDPNVASVYHLGFRGREIFYAMEFVPGETLECLIKRSGPINAQLTLKIATQIAAGLKAVHRQNLVHRDIKPSNIMVRLETGGGAVAKTIDLGLVKAIGGRHSQTTISIPGAFTGTPGFASPEQFSGIEVDIRSDLYSLGATLWMMLTGNPLFRGTPAEVLYQHLHSPLPLEQLDGVPQPIVAILRMLLEKDPRRRFQCPLQLLEVIRIIARTSCAWPATSLPEPREPLEKRVIAGRPLTGAFRSGSFEQSQTDEAFRFLAKACLINAKETWRTVVMLQRLSLEQTRPIWGKNGWPIH
jgi:serine/threonine protein kinase